MLHLMELKLECLLLFMCACVPSDGHLNETAQTAQTAEVVVKVW